MFLSPYMLVMSGSLWLIKRRRRSKTKFLLPAQWWIDAAKTGFLSSGSYNV
jgi:hypothetical protein